MSQEDLVNELRDSWVPDGNTGRLMREAADALDRWHDVRAAYLRLHDGQDRLAQQFPALAEALCRAVYVRSL